MKRLSLLSIVCVYSCSAIAFQAPADTTRPWKSKIETLLGFSQTSFTNWANGGENSLSAKGSVNIFEDYKEGKFSWNNYLGAAYMAQKQASFSSWRKADDKLNIFTKVGMNAWKNWDYTGLLEFKSQFAKGYNYPNDSVYSSKFMAPGYFQLAVGLSYKPVDYFSVLLSPIGIRLTVINDDTLSKYGAFGVKAGEKTLLQAGASVNALFKKDVIKNINLMSKLDLFSDYIKNQGSVIVNWENLLLLKVNRLISVNIATMLIYDDNLAYIDPKDVNKTPHGARTQFMETFTVGFTYSFIR